MEPGARRAAVETIHEGFSGYREAFDGLTRRARARFESRDWHGLQKDSRERLDLYEARIGRTLEALRRGAGPMPRERPAWSALKEAFGAVVADRPDRELAQTFFNSVTRRTLGTVGVEPTVEFVGTDFDAPAAAGPPVFATSRRDGSTRDLVVGLLRSLPLKAPFASLEADATEVAARIDGELGTWRSPALLEAVDVVSSVFFRGKGAYVVGRLRGAEGTRPLVLALLHGHQGVTVDAVLLDQDAASVVFGFTRSYFHVETSRSRDLVAFLASLMPRKRVAELYIGIGHNKHGKTELYRDLLRHLESSDDRFVPARGERGMVMAVFTLPSYDMVFKVIRDRFPEPKTVTRQGVLDRYALVFRHDRAGRLIDAQEYGGLAFARSRFSGEVLEELTRTTADSVAVGADQVAIRHLYVERRLLPLNLYLREAGYDAARAAVADYGQAIKDLAATDIFPGDVLLKNFGLTRHGRVVFYDYDELARLTDCRFREMPEPPGPEEAASAEPWFYVGEHDVFPEEFLPFLGLPRALKECFREVHGDLLRPEWWRRMQERLREGEIVDIFPYDASARLRRIPIE